MANITKDPDTVFCKICGSMLTWEHPEGSGHYQASSDFIGGDICRSCLTEQQEADRYRNTSATLPCFTIKEVETWENARTLPVKHSEN